MCQREQKERGQEFAVARLLPSNIALILVSTNPSMHLEKYRIELRTGWVAKYRRGDPYEQLLQNPNGRDMVSRIVRSLTHDGVPSRRV
jgi:hypothetical protein